MEIPEYGQRSVYCGQMVRENMNNLNTKRPIQNGIITDWDAMEDIWTHMYYENLLVPSEKYGILHTEPINNPASCRQKLTEVFLYDFFLFMALLLFKSPNNCSLPTIPTNFSTTNSISSSTTPTLSFRLFRDLPIGLFSHITTINALFFRLSSAHHT